ncbi:MAG: serine hydrolase domain-containing protein [Planctomycetota bacterium]
MIRSFLPVVFLIASTPLHAEELAGQVEAYLDQIHEQMGFRGAILVAKDGEVVWSGGRGTISQDSEVRIDNESLFEIASCTKPITALAVVRLAEEGKLNLDDAIAKYFDDVPESCRAITIRHLVMHTSGIPGTNVDGHPTDFRLALHAFLKGGPRHQPGTRYEYWNQGYAILSEIIAKASGKPYTDFVHESIYKPAGMVASCFTGDRCPDEMKAVVGTARGNWPRSSLDHPYGSYGYQYRGMGGAVTNLKDLWKLDRALAEDKLISRESHLDMIDVMPGQTGLGWDVSQDPTGSKSHGHSGSVRGFLADVTRYPSVDGCVFILECDQNSVAFSVLKAGLRQILFGKPTPFVPSALSAGEQRRLNGTYLDDRKRALTVTLDPRVKDGGSSYPFLQINWGGISTYGILGEGKQQQIRLYLIGEEGLKDDGIIDFQPATSPPKTATLRLGNGNDVVFQRVDEK